MKSRNPLSLAAVSIFSFLSVNFSVSAESVFVPLPTDLPLERNQQPYPGNINILNVNLKTVIGTGPCEIDDYSGCTLEDVNADQISTDKFKPEIKVHFQADDFPDDASVSNATFRVRGDSTRLSDHKSYRIKLDSKDALWRGERRLQLNKHPYELTRVSNKFSFDLMFPIPHLPSLRTQFVNLTIDEVPYGLFTHVEHVGKEYLENRGWDNDTPLYKAISTFFYVQEGMDLDADGKPLDLDSFEKVFEIKRGKDHSKLLAMLAAIENTNNNFQTDVFDKYFNKNNYLSWMAVNILMGNHDTIDRNFYFLNPLDSDTFYFIPWDYDDAWGFSNQPSESAEAPLPRWHQGIGTWWIQPLHQRYFSQPGAIDELKEAVKEIKETYFQEEAMQQRLDEYDSVISPLLNKEPDIFQLPTVDFSSKKAIFDEYYSIYNQIAQLAEKNYQAFLDEIDTPMTFFLGAPVEEGSSVKFDWREAVDLQGDELAYDIDVATEPTFANENIIYSAQGLSDTNYTVEWDKPNGQYYYRVIVRQVNDPENRWQVTPEYHYDEATDTKYENAYMFEIKTSNVSSTPDADAGNGSNGSGAPASSSGGGGSLGLFGLLSLLAGFAVRRQKFKA